MTGMLAVRDGGCTELWLVSERGVFDSDWMLLMIG